MNLRFVSSLFLLALVLHGADASALIQAGRKAAAANDAANVDSNFSQAIQILSPADPQFGLAVMEYTAFLRRSRMAEKAATVLKSAADRQSQAKVESPARVAILEGIAANDAVLRNAAEEEWARNELVGLWKAAAPGEPVVANNLVRLASTYERNGKFEPADKALEEALAILTKVYGANDTSVGFATAALSRVKIRSGKRDEAVALAKQAREIMQKALDASALPAGNAVSFPVVTTRKDPDLSDAARKAKIQGDVTLSLVVGEDGVPRDVHILIPLGAGMDEKAIEAVKQWRFDPGKKNDEAVAVRATVDVNVRLL